jgi:hypothetical protein
MQYDSPITQTQFQAFLDTASVSDTAAAAISALLNLDTAETVNLASWDGVNVQIPTGQTVPADVVVANIAGNQGNLVTLEIPDALNSAKAFVLQSDADLVVNFDASVAAAAEVSLARVAVAATSDFGLVVASGNGNDVITVTGDQNVYIDGGDGNDTITTGNGNNTVVAGAGNNNITTGSGNDTIILSGVNHSDIVHAGTGYDIVQLDGTAADYIATTGNSFNVNLTSAVLGSGQSAAIYDAEFLSFADNTSLVLAHSEAEASALRLYEGILGRDADLGGAQNFSAQVAAGASLTDIANQFLNSGEFGGVQTEAKIDTVYTALLGRQADDGGSATWQAALANGASLADVAKSIAVSAEAQELDVSNGDFVRDLYSNVLDRNADDDQQGLSNWVSQLFNGASRGDVAAAIVGSAEATEVSNGQFIESLYQTALGRDANQDAAGKAAWLAVLDNGGTQADVAIGIVGSAEAIAHNDNVVVLHGAV